MTTLKLTALCALGLAGLALARTLPPPAPGVLRPILTGSPGLGMLHLLGGWQGRWISAEDTKRQMTGPTVYEALTLAGKRQVLRGETPVSFGPPCQDTYGVPLSKIRDSQELELLTLPKLNTRPRPVTRLSTLNPTYREVVRQELLKRGLSNPVVRLIGVTKADLDGNGTDEVIIEASFFRERRDDLYPPPVGEPGDYSLLLLRQVKLGKPGTTVLAEHIAPLKRWTPGQNGTMPLANLFRLAGIADLNGDGRMELLTYSSYYEGHSFALSEWTPEGGEQVRLETGCGA